MVQGGPRNVWGLGQGMLYGNRCHSLSKECDGDVLGRFAHMSGIGASMRVLTRQVPRGAWRVGVHGGWVCMEGGCAWKNVARFHALSHLAQAGSLMALASSTVVLCLPYLCTHESCTAFVMCLVLPLYPSPFHPGVCPIVPCAGSRYNHHRAGNAHGG